MKIADLWEKHVLVDGAPVPGGLFDFGLFFFHNARALLERGSGPYFYLPKMQVRCLCVVVVGWWFDGWRGVECAQVESCEQNDKINK